MTGPNRLRDARKEMIDQSSGKQTAFRVVFFQIKNKIKDGYFYGSFSPFGGRRNCKLFVKDFSEINMRLFRNSAGLSEKVRHSNLLQPKFVEMTHDGSKVVIGYEFTKLFEDDRPVRLTYMSTGSSLDEWWIVQIKNLILTVDAMHEQQVYHGSLDQVRSYVLYDNNLYIVMPTVDGSSSSGSTREILRQTDISGLGSFLKRSTSGFCGREWKSFTDLCSRKRDFNNTKQLLNHPVLKNSEKRVEYLRAWLDCCFFSWKRSAGEIEHFRDNYTARLGAYFNHWNQPILPNTVYHSIYMFKSCSPNWSKYNPCSMFCFLLYLTNLIKHISDDGDLQTTTIIGNELLRMYPGLLGDLHWLCATSEIESYALFASEHLP